MPQRSIGTNGRGPDQIDTRLLAFVWQHSRRDQIGILVLTVLGFPLLYLSLELPKIIINDAISGGSAPRTVLGQAVEQIPWLLLLCVLLLGTIAINNVIKWLTNVGAGIAGERMLRRLRYLLFEQVLRFPPSRTAALRPGEVVQAVLGEIEPLGNFIGEVVATPVSQGGMLLVFIAFIFVQDPLLGLAATAMLPVQALITPQMQKTVVRLNRERAANTRRLADTLSSALSAIGDIRAHGVHRWHLARVSGRLHTNTEIRKALFRRKNSIKMVNNVLNQVPPFFFFAIGGAMVIEGRLDLGALVAVVSAYKEIGKPWRELLAFYQRWSDFRSRFVFVVESFSGVELMPASRFAAPPEPQPAGALVLDRVEAAAPGVDLRVPALTVPPGATAAVTGGDPAARGLLLRIASGMEVPRGGDVRLGDTDLATVPPAALGAAVGYVDAEPALIEGPIAANLDYGLYRAAPPLAGPGTRALRDEARRVGAPPLDPEGDWVDYAAAGTGGPEAHRARMIALAEASGMGPDLVVAALGARLAEAERQGWAAALPEARAAVARALAAPDLAAAVEPWDRAALAENASLLENLLFALPAAPDRAMASLPEDPAVARMLAAAGAEPLLADIGADLVRALAALAETVSPDSPLLDRVGSYARADVLAAAAAVAKLPVRDRDLRPGSVRQLCVALAARYTPVRDRFDLITPARRTALMAARRALQPAVARAPFLVALDAETPPPSMTVAESLIGGRRREDRRSGWRRLEAALVEATAGAGLRARLLAVGLDAPLVTGAVTPALRRRIGLVRTVLKRPALVALADPALADDPAVRRFLRETLPEAVVLLAAEAHTLGTAPEGVDLIAALDADGALGPARRTA